MKMRSSEEIPDRLLIDYLLGAASAEDTERLDALSITDGDIAWRLKACEDDLADSYVRGELSGEKLERFRSVYLSGQRSGKVEFAESLCRLADRGAEGARSAIVARAGNVPGNALRISGLRWNVPAWAPRWALVSLIVLVLVGTGVVLLHSPNRGVRQATQQPQNAPAAPTQPPAASAEQPRATTIATFFLAPPTRAIGSLPVVTVARASEAVQLRLQLEVDDFPRYRALLKDPQSGHTLWRSEALQATPHGRTVAVTIPSSSFLQSENYSLELLGIPPQGGPEVITDYVFKVRIQ
jgi:hypothetical protein